MLTDVIEYSGLHAKIKTLESRLMKYDDYLNLSSEKDVTSYANRLLENTTVHTPITGGRFSIEKSLVNSMYSDFSNVFGFINNFKSKAYLNCIFLKYEIGIIKSALRSFFDERDANEWVPATDPFLSRRLNINLEKLASSKSIKEFLSHLENSKYFKVLNKINVDNPSLFDFETQLDFYYYFQVWKYQYKYLNGSSLASQERINGVDIDLHNILYIYRLKEFYDLPESIIYTHLIPINYRIRKNVIDMLVHSNTTEEFIQILEDTPYKGIFTSRHVNEAEKACYAHMIKVQLEEERKNPYSISTVTAYFSMKGQELRNLITLTECIRYGLGSEASMSKLNIIG